ncbi:FG-GAP-like repeat-containing protein [Streptomyces sp. SID3212]|uniref:FG-GAP-like repeat-containing protein n=1 Tax=Streptomyces sp. SID3212 TaxID=2690259 RepID=UPI001371E545|nr:FG-GAP-like repeat-containing protein [Streptomyces sp. SID3212]MYV53169.1 VCBS repeat-containing protein [Streptomyces sp. SID3212]
MHSTLRTTLSLAAVTALASGLLTVAAGGAAAAPSGLAGDFNGDGYRDLAIGAFMAKVGTKASAGRVAVVYGTAKGLDPGRRTVISQDTAGIPGAAEAYDDFGRSLAVADLNRDGYSDLVVSAPDEDNGKMNESGTVVVVWGGAKGLSGGTTVPNPDPVQYGTYFGQSLAAGDFTGDGKPDLAIVNQGHGVPAWEIRLVRGPFAKAGSHGKTMSYKSPLDRPNLTAGKVTKDAAVDLVVQGQKINKDPLGPSVFYKGGSGGLVKGGTLPAGTNAAIGDLDKDGYGDIVIGNPDEPDREPSGSKGGEVGIVYGAAAGPSAGRRTNLTQNSAGVPGTSVYGDDFGASVAVGDFDKDGYGDLAAGVPGKTFGVDPEATWSAGAVVVLRGSAKGVTTTGARSLSQDTAGVPGASEDGDGFGERLLASDVNRDGYADLSVTAEAEDSDAGGLTFLRGAAGTGFPAAGSIGFGPRGLGLPAAYSAFGDPLAG